jgi:hypothetical protein
VDLQSKKCWDCGTGGVACPVIRGAAVATGGRNSSWRIQGRASRALHLAVAFRERTCGVPALSRRLILHQDGFPAQMPHTPRSECSGRLPGSARGAGTLRIIRTLEVHAVDQLEHGDARKAPSRWRLVTRIRGNGTWIPNSVRGSCHGSGQHAPDGPWTEAQGLGGSGRTQLGRDGLPCRRTLGRESERRAMLEGERPCRRCQTSLANTLCLCRTGQDARIAPAWPRVGLRPMVDGTVVDACMKRG